MDPGWASFLAATLGAAVTAIAGGGGLWYSARLRREEREAEQRDRDQERERIERREDRGRVRDLYKRVAELGQQYRFIEGLGSEHYWEHFKEFLPRFHALQAELYLLDTPEIGDSFRKYLDTVQEAQHEVDQSGFSPEFWEHADKALEEVTFQMRNDLARREKRDPVCQRS